MTSRIKHHQGRQHNTETVKAFVTVYYTFCPLCSALTQTCNTMLLGNAVVVDVSKASTGQNTRPFSVFYVTLSTQPLWSLWTPQSFQKLEKPEVTAVTEMVKTSLWRSLQMHFNIQYFSRDTAGTCWSRSLVCVCVCVVACPTSSVLSD